MGIFDFVRNAGASVFGSDKDKEEPTKPLSQHLKEHGISPAGLKFHFSNEAVTVSGEVPDLATREKIVTIIGNVKGVAKVDDQLTIARPPAAGNPDAATTQPEPAESGGDWASRTYTVKSGDTLSKIAKAMYGDASKYPLIFEANTPMLKDPNKIYPGQVLRIPPLD